MRIEFVEELVRLCSLN